MPRSKEAFDAMRETTKQKIETAALALFARRGLSVTIGEIASTAGVSQGLLYSHYASKDALIGELVKQAADISGQSMSSLALGDDPAVVKLKETSSMMCQMFSEYQVGVDYFMFMVQVGMSGFALSDMEMYAGNSPSPLESLAQILAQGQREGSVADGDPLQLATVYWAAIQGMCCYAITGIPLVPEADMLNRIVLKEKCL